MLLGSSRGICDDIASGGAPEVDISKIKDFGLKNYTHLSHKLPHTEDKEWKLTCALPYNCHFQQWIELEAPAGKTLKFNSSNPLVLYLTPTESMTTVSNSRIYEAKNWVSGEGAIYTIPAGVSVKSVKYHETGYDTTFAGSFVCNDEDFNILWKKAARTAYLCMRDHFYDCPDRERVGFWGDGTPELNTCFYAFDTKSHALCKDLVLRKLEPRFYPGQHLEFLGEYGIWYYYLHTGDIESIKTIYDQTKTFLFKTYKFGNRNTWFDWGKDSKDTSVIENCFVYIDLGTLREMAKVTGHESDIAEIDSRREAIRSTFDAKFWKGSYYQSSDVKEPDDRANAMAILADLAPPERWESLYNNVISKTTNSSCFFDRWVFEALIKMGKQDKALLRMSTRYRTMIPASFTSLWEHYDRWWASWKNAFDDASSLNHGWNPPALVLSQDIAGVRPIEPSWTTFEVMPKEAFLNSIKMSVPTIKGAVDFEMKKTKSNYSMSILVPGNTKAIIGIPKGSFLNLISITANGRLVWNGSGFKKTDNLTWIGDDGKYIKFQVPAGKWKFVGQGVLSLDSPKPLPQPNRREIALNKDGWTASASVEDGSYLFSGAKIPIAVPASNALDGDHWTGWRDMTKTQYPGQWFQVDMKTIKKFDKIVLDNTWAQWDSPNAYEVTISNDSSHWSKPIASGKGLPGITPITFPAQSARFIRVTQTGSDPTYNWSIYEFDVFKGMK